MRVVLSAIAILAAAAILSGCGEVIAAVLAPETMAINAAASTANSLASSVNAATAREISGEGQTLSDLDRILADVPEGSEQHQDLTALRNRLASPDSLIHPRGVARPFVSDPKLGHDFDRRIAEPPPVSAQQLPGRGGLDLFGSGVPGHQLRLDPPRATGSDADELREQPKPFHVARTSGLDQWEPRFYGTTMPHGTLAGASRRE